MLPFRSKCKIENQSQPAKNQECKESGDNCVVKHMLLGKIKDCNYIDGHEKYGTQC